SMSDGQNPQFGLCGHGGVARLSGKDGQLPDDITHSEGRQVSSLARHRGGPIEEHEHLEPNLTLTDQNSPGRENQLGCHFADLLKLLLGAFREHRYRRKALQVLVTSHRSSSS